MYHGFCYQAPDNIPPEERSFLGREFLRKTADGERTAAEMRPSHTEPNAVCPLNVEINPFPAQESGRRVI